MNQRMNIRQYSVLLSRVSLFLIYFWFGLIKVIGLANPELKELIQHLLSKTMPFFPFSSFIVLFGLFEMLIGILFVIPGKEKYALILFFIHIITTVLPIFIMSEVWVKFLVPTLEGQYIIKNIALIACALTIWASIESPKRPVDLPQI